MRRHVAAMQRIVVGHANGRIMTDAPTPLRGAATQIDILVVKEEVLIETAEIPETVAAYEETTPAHPGDARPVNRGAPVILPPGARQGHATDRTEQRGKRSG